MAASRRLPPADGGDRCAVRAAVATALRHASPPGAHLAVALSGGRDSIALLDAAANVAATSGDTLVAFHVHHGLSSAADAWMAFCADACARRDIAFAARNVEVRNAGDGVEATARERRYEALAAMAREHRVDAILLAHHADDQAETLLLQLLRGAGPRGLAAMPVVARARGTRFVRPFLSLPRAAIDAYVTSHALAYVDDDSNAHTSLRRNALRARVIPALRTIAPGYPATLVRAARHQSDAIELLDDLARLDAHGAGHDSLDLAALRALAAPRARNLLRWFLRERGLRAPSAARLDAMLQQLLGAPPDARVAVEHDGAVIGIHRARVVVHTPAVTFDARPWRGEPEITLPHGVLALLPAEGEGVARQYLHGRPVTIRMGGTGERLRLAVRGGRRNVMDLLREAGVPPWQRLAMPRLYCGDTLAAVAGTGIDASFAAGDGEAGLRLEWRACAGTHEPAPGQPAKKQGCGSDERS
jgi:tRNA(Ile)-lysidine synthase